MEEEALNMKKVLKSIREKKGGLLKAGISVGAQENRPGRVRSSSQRKPQSRRSTVRYRHQTQWRKNIKRSQKELIIPRK